MPPGTGHLEIAPAPLSELRSGTLIPEHLARFCQRRADYLTRQEAIVLVRIVYRDPCTQHHETIWSERPDRPLPANLRNNLKSETWLSDFPSVLSLTPISLENSPYFGYVCPIGYHNQRPEYLLALTETSLTAEQKYQLVETATCLVDFVELYQNSVQHQSEIHLLEHVIHRVGHQLRNPLGLISLYSEMLCLGAHPPVVQEQATIIRDTVQHLLTHLTELIYCGQSDRLNTSLQDLHLLVSESVTAVQPLLEQKQLTVSFPQTPVLLQVDRLQIKQVLDNLLSNAIHFSPLNGTITLNWWSFQGEVLIQISDQGSGIPTDQLQKIFDPFFTRRPGGTGLGLTIAKKIVLDHQGNLWAQSLPEGGARFSLTLPRPTP